MTILDRLFKNDLPRFHGQPVHRFPDDEGEYCRMQARDSTKILDFGRRQQASKVVDAPAVTHPINRGCQGDGRVGVSD